jgi:hypothetical protein
MHQEAEGSEKDAKEEAAASDAAALAEAAGKSVAADAVAAGRNEVMQSSNESSKMKVLRQQARLQIFMKQYLSVYEFRFVFMSTHTHTHESAAEMEAGDAEKAASTIAVDVQQESSKALAPQSSLLRRVEQEAETSSAVESTRHLKQVPYATSVGQVSYATSVGGVCVSVCVCCVCVCVCARALCVRV